MPARVIGGDTGLAKPIRIMLTSDAIGGVWTYTFSLAAGLASIGCICTIVVLGPAPTLLQHQAAQHSGVDLVESRLELDWLSRRLSDVEATSLRLADTAKLLNADLVHLHTPVFAAAKWTMPVVAVTHSCTATWWQAVHGGEIPKSLVWLKDVMREGLSTANAVIAPSHSFASALQDVYGVIEGLSVIYNGVPSCARTTQSSEKRSYLLSVGRLWDKGKNMNILDAAACLQSFPIKVAGSTSGPDGSHFEAENLVILGVLSDDKVMAACRQAAMFLAPSLYEPFGLAVLEAASMGVPLLLADIPTFRELWTDAAIFVPPRDPRAWADAMSSAMKNDNELRRLGAAARRRSRLYQRQAMVDRTRLLHSAIFCESNLQGRG